MNRDELIQFISHYKRLTRYTLLTITATADVVYPLNGGRCIQKKVDKTYYFKVNNSLKKVV